MTKAPAYRLGNGQPRYALLAQAIAGDIDSGRYPVGSLLPTEMALCQQYAMSRHTVREAMRRLRELGMVSRQQGVGTKVEASSTSGRYVQSLRAVSDLYEYAKETRLSVKAIDELVADHALAALLQCKIGQRWIRVSALRYAENKPQPICRTTIYIAAAFAAIRAEIGATRTPVYKLIEDHYGERVHEIRQEIGACILDARQAAALRVKAGAPELSVTRHYLGASAQLLEVAVNIYPAERFSYTMRLRVETDEAGDD